MELVSGCVECGLAEPESLASLGGSAPGVVDGILSQAIKSICHYLHGMRSKGLFFLPDLRAGFTCHVDADWAGNWLKSRPNDKTGALL